MIALNIKNPEAHRLARELAQRKSRLERIMEISVRTAPLMNDGRTSKELLDELYDEETGLPI